MSPGVSFARIVLAGIVAVLMWAMSKAEASI